MSEVLGSSALIQFAAEPGQRCCDVGPAYFALARVSSETISIWVLVLIWCKMKSKPLAKQQEPSRKLDKYWVPIVAKTLDVLDCFNSVNEALALEEVVRRTGISHTSAFRILHTLVVRDYLTQSGRQYRLSRLRKKDQIRLRQSLDTSTSQLKFRKVWKTLQWQQVSPCPYGITIGTPI